MSKVTDRYDQQNIINLARQQYETDRRKKLPSIIVPLVSAGKVYPQSNPMRQGTVEMRHMTAYDEDILTNTTYIKSGVVFDKLLESIILTPIAIKDICDVDKLGLILNARISAYGSEYNVIVKDPETGNSLNRTIDLNSIQSKPYNKEADENGEFEYKINDSYTLKYKLYGISTTDTTSIIGYLKSIITQVNSTRNKSDIDEFIQYDFLANDSRIFRKHVVDNTPELDLMIDFEGENGSTFQAGFPFGPDLFWF